MRLDLLDDADTVSHAVAVGTEADFSMFNRHRLVAVNGTSTLTFKHSYTWWGKLLQKHSIMNTQRDVGIEGIDQIYSRILHLNSHNLQLSHHVYNQPMGYRCLSLQGTTEYCM